MKCKGRCLETKEWIFSDGLLKDPDGVIIMIVEVSQKLFKTSPVDPKSVQFFVRTDIFGNDIYTDDLFSFTYLDIKNSSPVLEGIFKWNEEQLRYEIIVIDNVNYGILCYTGDKRMSDFRLLKQ